MIQKSIVMFGDNADWPCPRCNNNGKTLTPEWAKYWDDRAAADIDHLPMHAERRVQWETEHPQPEMPEEQTCPRCHGIAWVPTDSGRALLDFLTRYTKIESKIP